MNMMPLMQALVQLSGRPWKEIQPTLQQVNEQHDTDLLHRHPTPSHPPPLH